MAPLLVVRPVGCANVDKTHERRPEGRRSILRYHHAGRPSDLDGHLLRGGAARTIYHCTSPPFGHGKRYRKMISRASTAIPVGEQGRARELLHRRTGQAPPGWARMTRVSST